MIRIKPNSLEAKIFEALSHGQVSLEFLYTNLRTRKDVIDQTLNRMRVQGIVHFDILPDVTYISLARADVQHEAIKPMKSGPKTKSRSKPREDDRAYG